MISRKRILPTTPSLTPLPLLLSRDVTGHIPAGARHFLPQGPTHRHCSRYGGGWIILFDILLDLHKYHLLYHILDIIGDGDGDGDGDGLGLGLGFGFGLELLGWSVRPGEGGRLRWEGASETDETFGWW